MIRAFLIAFLFLIHQVAAAQPEKETPPLKKIKILSWNIYMLPHLVASQSSKKERAQAIGEILMAADYDVIFFQEAFHSTARSKILARLQTRFPYQAGPANKRLFSLKVNSGLWVLSKYPIVFCRSIIYKNKFGVDALSRKGALLVELDVDGQRIQIAGTHLQNCGPMWLRQAQCVEFYKRLLMPNVHEGVPQIICGDFNIDRYSTREDYRFMLHALDATDSNEAPDQYSYDRLANDLHVEEGPRRDLIDYILFRSNGGMAVCSNTVMPLKRRWCATHADLSDHYPLQAEIDFSNWNYTASATWRRN
ncbi:MAG TPA: sphingomyelin phosphodiesterase [Cyclobacteriaceae bacterium]|nr:sphingomyelin phosphodiesterase [Cyclobacteriaceae bacterium]